MDFSHSNFDQQFYYEGSLGAFWQPEKTLFRVWAPYAQWVNVKIYETWEATAKQKVFPIKRCDRGLWESTVLENLSGKYYTYETYYEGRGALEAVDPYAKAVSPQGQRGLIFDSQETFPQDWEKDKSPVLAHVSDSIIYELHIRDLSSLDSSGISHRGRFLGLAEESCRNPDGLSTGIDHLVELGITHVHLLPVFDFDEMDDLDYRPDNYNWGYNPRNFNALKGAYGTNPQRPQQTILELRKVVQTLHRRGLRVVMDVVYNHTYATTESNLNKIFPFYYYRMYESRFSNGSGCGNELATERPMVRKMIIDSLLHWKTEFHLDGFRFDLMGLYDIDTMNTIVWELRRKDPCLLLYGEGWTGGLSTLQDNQKAIKSNAHRLREIAFFNDDTRDAVKGHVFEATRRGFCNGGTGLEEMIKLAATGCVYHPQIDTSKLFSPQAAWAQAPHQTINYVASHDNHTLWDKLAKTNANDSEETRIQMAKLAHGLIFTCQGIPFLQAGEEFLRTKQGVENSYKSPDSVNGLDWIAKTRHKDVFEYFRGLIQFRRAHPGLRLRSADQMKNHMMFLNLLEQQMVAWMIHGRPNEEPSDKILVILNGCRDNREVYVPEGNWGILINHRYAGTKPIDQPSNGIVCLPGYSLMVLVTYP